MTAATFKDIEGWFDRGVKQGARWMLVICDTFDHGDYPSFFTRDEKPECIDKIFNLRQGKESMQKLMEVYDLEMNKVNQMKERRAYNEP